jgi:hypothetical protein
MDLFSNIILHDEIFDNMICAQFTISPIDLPTLYDNQEQALDQEASKKPTTRLSSR